MHHRSVQQSIRSVKVRAACVLLGSIVLISTAGCGGSKPFVLPEDPRGTRGEQVDRAHRLASKAEDAAKAGKSEEAISLYNQALAEYREFPAAWLNLGVLYMKAGDGLRASEALKNAADTDMTDPRPYYNMGVMYEDKNLFPDAIKYYNLALERDPNLLPALRRSVVLEMQTNSLTPASGERAHRALMLESDSKYKNLLSQALRQIEENARPSVDMGPK